VATQRLGEQLAAEGGLPADDLPRRPSGRVDRDAADAVFARRRAEAEAAPDDWRSWYRLGIAYDDAGDRRRAREAMRKAITLATH
jgi:cytochrome c-type biogenesis protein CcmH/NrfG